MRRMMLDEFPWAVVETTKAFITGLFTGACLDRPGVIMHFPSGELPEPPAGVSALERELWNTFASWKRRPMGGDDFVPTLSTGAGTCTMATAFGCAESCTNGLYWVTPCIHDPAEIDTLRKPTVTAGKLGAVLGRTRALIEMTDERLPVRVMDFQSPFTTVEQMLGSDLFFLMPYDEPERLHRIMDIVTDFAIDFFSAQMALLGPRCCPGIWPSFWFPTCAGIQMSDDNLVNVSPEVYEEFVVPYNSRVSAAFGGMFLHSCTITEAALPAVAKIQGLTGINCDISTSVTTARLLDVFGERIVVAPHAYINTNTNFHSYTEFMEHTLEGWHPGRRLFVHPCSVLYQPDTAREIVFNPAEVDAALRRIPAWERDHPAAAAVP